MIVRQIDGVNTRRLKRTQRLGRGLVHIRLVRRCAPCRHRRLQIDDRQIVALEETIQGAVRIAVALLAQQFADLAGEHDVTGEADRDGALLAGRQPGDLSNAAGAFVRRRSVSRSGGFARIGWRLRRVRRRRTRLRRGCVRRLIGGRRRCSGGRSLR
ncbi:hypothetical protein D3C73_1220540 [compost metagenome]